MGRAAKALAAISLIIIGAGLAVFLWRQGLERAGFWAGVLALFPTIITAIAGVWAVRLAIPDRRRAADQEPGSASGYREPGEPSSRKTVIHVKAKRDSYAADTMNVYQGRPEEPEAGESK